MSKGIALVTGSAQGIGRAIALRLADDGFDVGLNDLSSKREKLEAVQAEIIQKGRRSTVVAADVSVEAEVQTMVEGTVRDLGGLDVMVANAGIGAFVPLLELKVEDWDRVFSVNARGVFLSYKFAALQMVKQGRGGRIIGMSSIAGKQGVAILSAYSATKFAIRGLTQSAAIELGPHRITVNAIAPGAISGTGADTDILSDEEKNAILQTAAEKTALGYCGQPNDVASVVSFLVSDGAHFITGQTITADGGSVFD